MRSVFAARAHALVDVLRAVLAHPGFQRESEVLIDRIARVERVVLEDQRHVALGRAPAAHVLAADVDRASIRLLQPRDEAKRRRLAGAGRAEQHEEFAVGDVEREIADGNIAAETLGDRIEANLRHLSCRA